MNVTFAAYAVRYFFMEISSSTIFKVKEKVLKVSTGHEDWSKDCEVTSILA